MLGKKNILIGITSSIASYKIYELIRLYKKNGFEVKTILTNNALNFVSPLVLETLSQNKTYFEQFNAEYNTQHINLALWADIFVVAPTSANTLSKFAHGISDNLLSSVFCTYLGTKKPILIAPAMNCNMWNNPIIQKNINILKNYGCFINEPKIGYLACGEEGIGRLDKIENIYHNSLRLLYQNKKNNNKKVIVTLGGTKEKIDSVRYISNFSSGKTGIALADKCYQSGYDIKAISTVEFERPYERIYVQNAQEMFETLKKEDFEYLIMASAVADFKVENESKIKISKEDVKDELILKLTKNPDIISYFGQNKKENQKIIGFCLTDNNLMECAKNKLKNKNLDFIIANDTSVLNQDKNNVIILDKSGNIKNIALDSKENTAEKILEVICD